jgi:hypothetical protein
MCLNFQWYQNINNLCHKKLQWIINCFSDRGVYWIFMMMLDLAFYCLIMKPYRNKCFWYWAFKQVLWIMYLQFIKYNWYKIQVQDFFQSFVSVGEWEELCFTLFLYLTANKLLGWIHSKYQSPKSRKWIHSKLHEK